MPAALLVREQNPSASATVTFGTGRALMKDKISAGTSGFRAVAGLPPETSPGRSIRSFAHAPIPAVATLRRAIKNLLMMWKPHPTPYRSHSCRSSSERTNHAQVTARWILPIKNRRKSTTARTGDARVEGHPASSRQLNISEQARAIPAACPARCRNQPAPLNEAPIATRRRPINKRAEYATTSTSTNSNSAGPRNTQRTKPVTTK